MAFTLVLTGLVLPDPVPALAEVDIQPVPVGDMRPDEKRSIKPTEPSQMIGFDWKGKSAAEIEFRVRTDEGWSEWFHAVGNPDEGPDTGSRESSSRTTTSPAWIGDGIEEIQLKAESGSPKDVRAHLIKSEESQARGRIPYAGAAAGQPWIVPRSGWGADESWRTCGPDYASTVRNAFVHHTVSGNSYSQEEAPAVIRGIYRYHTQTNGWCDIGYNFLIDRFGTIYEGRYGGIDAAVIGAHAGGFNSASTGMAIVGTHSSEGISSRARESLRKLLGWKLDLHGVDPNTTIEVTSRGSSKYPEGTVVTIWTISGHRDVSATACPGDGLYPELPRFRADVEWDIGESRWHDLGGYLTSSPEVASWGEGRLDVFVRGGDGGVWYRTENSGVWSGWDTLGGYIIGDPSAVSWSPGGKNFSPLLARLDVFVKGGDGALWQMSFENGKWSGWRSLGGYLSSGPDSTSRELNTLDVVVLGGDGAMWMNSWDGFRWSGWGSLGGYFTADPSIVSWGPEHLSVIGRGGDGALWARTRYSGAWGAWQSLGGYTTSGPDAASTDPGGMDVLVKGGDGALWQRTFSAGSWSGWSRLAGAATSDPSLTSWGPGRLDAVVRRPGHSLGRRWRQDGVWNR